MRGPVPVLSDCPTCRVEAAFVELVDPEDRLGVAIEGECRLCRHRMEYGLIVRDGDDLTDLAAVTVALARWAAEEGEPEVERFVAVNFGNLSVGHVAARLLAGERVETGFDVVAFFFPGAAGGSSGSAAREVGPPPLPTTRSQDAFAPAPLPDFSGGDIGRALVSVVVADGEVRAVEERVLVRLCAALGTTAPPRPWRVWRPHELGVPPDPGRVLAGMREVALADGEADGTEVRVLEEYARAWRVPLNRRGLRPPTAWEGVVRGLAGLVGR